MKKLMILGGSRYVLPLIKAAHKLGIYVITCDYLPGNIAHKYSDEYCNVSIVDKEATLEVARRLKINGITSFACDPGVVTAAYVAEQMDLPVAGPYNSVCVLQNKGRFRSFLQDHNFNVPFAKSYISVQQAIKEADKYRWPVIIKPTDSAGSKGVSRVEHPNELEEKAANALSYSRVGEFIIEEFIQQKGFSSDSDSFSVDGELRFVSFDSQRFDVEASNPYTPAAYSWPSSIPKNKQAELTSEIQRLIRLLGMGTSIYNIETREGVDGKAYIMECSPRGGGNRLAECLEFATGVNLIENTVRAAVGMNVLDIAQKPYQGFWAEVILHSKRAGIFKGVVLSDAIRELLFEEDIWIQPGTPVGGFTGANEAIGTIIIKNNDQAELENIMSTIDAHVKVIVG